VKHFAIELTENAVCFSHLEEAVVAQHTYTFKEKTDHSYAQELTEYLDNAGFKISEFSDCTISWGSMRSSLVPTNVFNETNPVKLFQLCFGEEIPKEHIDYNRISEHGIVNIYEIPQWVKSFFISRFPKAIIQHSGSHLIRGMFAQPTFKLRSILVLFENNFLLTMVKENKLLFYSYFDYQDVNDVLYHYLFSIQQKDLVGESATVQLCKGVGSSEETISAFMELIKKIPDRKNDVLLLDNLFTTNSQKLCV
jgi:hypothetical protein